MKKFTFQRPDLQAFLKIIPGSHTTNTININTPNYFKKSINKGEQLLSLGLALAIACLLNYGMDENQAWQYRWLLAPIAILLEAVTNSVAVWQPNGYVLPKLNILLHPACSGLRFMGMLWIGMGLVAPTLYDRISYLPNSPLFHKTQFQPSSSKRSIIQRFSKTIPGRILILLIFGSSIIYGITILVSAARILIFQALLAFDGDFAAYHSMIGGFVYLVYFLLISWGIASYLEKGKESHANF